MMTDRYKVKKESGSFFAHVIDTQTDKTVIRFNILRTDGWERADRHCAKLNAAIQSTKPSTDTEHKEGAE